MLEDLRHHRLMHPATLFFMVTGEGRMGKVVSAAELAPADYILKPFAADAILERITRALDKRAVFLPIHALIDMGDQAGAIAACVAGAERQPRYAVDFERLRAELHLELGEAAAAEELYRALYESRGMGWARLGQAKTLFLRGRYAEAQAMLEQLLARYPRFLDAYDWLARVHEAQDGLPQSQAVLAEAVALSPHALRRLRRLGEVAFAAGDLDTAAHAWREVVDQSRFSEFRDPQDHTRLVQALLRQGDPVQAATVIRDLDKAMTGQRNGVACGAIAAAMLHDYTGNDMRLQRSLDQALAGCRIAQHLSPDLKLELARTCLAHGRARQGAELVREVMRNASGPAGVDKASAMLTAAGHGALAERLAQESRQEVGDMVAHGAALAKHGDYRSAVELMLEAVAKLPDNPQVVFNAAVAVLKCLEHTGWDDRLGQYALNLIAGVRRLDPLNAKLNALAALHQQILKKYNIRAARWNDGTKVALL
jgi:tetratricopeptide (TPR) repeat protein